MAGGAQRIKVKIIYDSQKMKQTDDQFFYTNIHFQEEIVFTLFPYTRVFLEKFDARIKYIQVEIVFEQEEESSAKHPTLRIQVFFLFNSP